MKMDREQKYEILFNNYSNPDIVVKRAFKQFDNDDNLQFDISTRKNKKYQIKGDFTDNKWIHFGEMGYEDYTFHKDKDRLNKFRSRNRDWGYRSAKSPAFLSYVLLW